MRNTREKDRGRVPCGRGPFHVSTEDRCSHTWWGDLLRVKSECVWGGASQSLCWYRKDRRQRKKGARAGGEGETGAGKQLAVAFLGSQLPPL